MLKKNRLTRVLPVHYYWFFFLSLSFNVITLIYWWIYKTINRPTMGKSVTRQPYIKSVDFIDLLMKTYAI